ncbi:MAG TPA: amino acid adenylation domain-containing protein, partial [Methylocystis sp.]|nr:amino acid adenylation domain-containing protein [Methylocystis sp.]
KANQLAHHLRDRGVGPDVVVGLCVERSLEMVIGLLGILKAGGAYLPLDPNYPFERLSFMIEDAKPKLILTQRRFSERLPDGVETLRLDADGDRLATEGEENIAAGASAQNLAYVIYTSGSTGKPKGVAIAHRNVARLFAATQAEYGFGANDVWTLFHSFAFDFSVWEIWGALLYGGRLVVAPYLVSRSPEAFHALLAREGVTVLNQTPSSFYQLDAADAARGEADALALRLVIFGGEALEARRLADWFRRHGDCAPTLVNMYGITETTVHVTLQRMGADAPEGGVGRPLGDLQAYLLDAQMHPVPLGVAGELYIGGAGLARGYVNRPDLTAERFVPNPFGGDGERLYRTGDLAGYREDGTIDYLGRIDHQVKIRGFRIELGEIEAALARVAQVREAIVLAREDGPSGKRLVAYVTARANAALDVAELRAAIQGELPDYMVPSAIVVLEQLPLTANGKIDRKALPAPDMEAQTVDRYVAPRTGREETLCRIWAEVLGLDRVGVEDNFFELGGDSLAAVRLISRMSQVMGVSIPLELVFKEATVASAASFLELLSERQEQESGDASDLSSELEEFEI